METQILPKPLKTFQAQCIADLKTYLLTDLMNGDQFWNLTWYVLKGHCHISLEIQAKTEQIIIVQTFLQEYYHNVNF